MKEGIILSKFRFKYKDIILGIILVLIIYEIIKDPTKSINSAKEGLNIWLNILIPSLFPFIFITDLLISFGIVSLFTKYLEPIMNPLFKVSGIGIFPLSMNIMSGYPVGSRITSKIRAEGLISRTEANRLICFTSTSGPLYVLGTVGTGMLGLPELGLLLILPHYLGAITNGLILSLYSPKEGEETAIEIQYRHTISHKNTLNFGSVISKAVKDGMDSMIMIGGLVIIFSVIIDILISSPLFSLLTNYISKAINTEPEVVKGITAGIVEITNGCNIVSKLNIPTINKILIINFIIGWGGFSVHSQAMSFISKTDIKTAIYIFSKFFHGVFSSLYTYLIYLIFYKDRLLLAFKPLRGEINFNIKSWLEILTSSTLNALCLLIFIFILSALVKEIKQRA